MNEKYGIELELITNKFKEKINRVKSTFQSIGKQKVDMSKQVRLDNLQRQFELASNQAEALRHKLKGLNSELANKQQWEVGTKSYIKLQNEIDKTRLQLEKAGLKADTLNQKIEVLESANLSKGIGVTASALNKNIDKMTSKIKRFALSLLSIRSIWALVSRASSAYLTQDTALAERMQSVWAGLGAMLAPIIEGIVNILGKAVKYINIFIKALTGVDLLARATTKSMNGTAKSAKALNKALAGFDELTNLDTDTGGGTGGSFGLAGLEDIKINTSWADRIEQFGKWVKKNSGPVLGFLSGLGITLLGLKATGTFSKIAINLGLVIMGVSLYAGSISNILNGNTSVANLLSGLAGAGLIGKGATALLGLSGPVGLTITASLMIVLAAIWLQKKTDEYMSQIAGILGIEYDNKNFFQKWQIQVDLGLQFMGLKDTEHEKIKQLLEDQETLFERVGKVIKPVYDWFTGLVTKTNETSKAIGEWFTNLVKDTNDTWETIKQTFSGVPTWIDTNIIKPVTTFFTDLWDNLTEGVSTTWDGIVSFVKGIPNWVNEKIVQPVKNFFTNLWNGLKDGVTNTWNGIVGFIQGIPNWLYNNVVLPIKNFFTDLWNGVKNTFSNVWNWILGAFSKGGQIFNGVKEGIVNIFKTAVNGVIGGINSVMSSALGGLNSILNKIKSVNIFDYKPFDGFWGWNPISIPQIPKLAVGTNYVPEDQLAYIHKGEAVIPKRFNSQEYFGNGNNETNSLLEQVIEAINNIEVNPYTTIKDVGKASLSYINSKSRQLGESVVV